uniref:Uncharacterized protein n=1 Tax=Anas zonorhyncha TaxID=75864 RepID=A0A8B9UYA3_9AVES
TARVEAAASWLPRCFTISDSPGMTLNFTAGRSLQLASITEILGKRRLSSDGFERGDELCGEPHVLRSFAERGETGELNHLLAYSFLLPLSFRSTHIQVVGFDNRPFARTSCGTEGFQNAKKGTAIAAQTAGIAAATVSLLTSAILGGKNAQRVIFAVHAVTEKHSL